MLKVPNELMLNNEELIESGEWVVVTSRISLGNMILRVGEFCVYENLEHKTMKMGDLIREVEVLKNYYVCYARDKSAIHSFLSKMEAIAKCRSMNQHGFRDRASRKINKQMQIEGKKVKEPTTPHEKMLRDYMANMSSVMWQNVNEPINISNSDL